MQGSAEIRPLTGLRGVSAVYVMIFHYTIGLPFSNPATTFIAHGYLAVDLFFVLSGFVMALQYSRLFAEGWSTVNFLRFLGRRIARIYPLYAILMVCAAILAACGLLESSNAVPLPMVFVSNLFMVQSWGLAWSLDAPSWSISAEWAAYLLFPLLLWPCLARNLAVPALLLCTCALALLLLCLVPVSYGHQPKPNAYLDLHTSDAAISVLRCIPEFTLGILAFRASGSSLGRRVGATAWTSSTLSTVVVILMARPGTDVAVVLLFPLLILSLVSDKSPLGRVLSSSPIKTLGVLSYSIYLVHDLFGGLLEHVHQRVEALGISHAQAYAAVLGVALTLPCSYMTFRFIELPCRRWLQGAFDGKFGGETSRGSRLVRHYS